MSTCDRIATSTITEPLTSPITVSGDELSLTDKICSMGSDLYSAVAEFAYENPISTGVIVVGSIFIIGGLLYFTRETPLPNLQSTMTKVDLLLEDEKFDEAEVAVGKYVSDLCKATKFKKAIPQAANNKDLEKYLSSKIFSVSVRRFSPQVKAAIISRVISDTKELLNTAEQRVKADLSAGRLDHMISNRNVTITAMTPLGDESHNEGKIPLKITFSNGQSIVYKPRSMLPEQVLFDSHQGLFKELGFGTYNVVCSSDDKGEYGYADLIVNNVGTPTNTVHTPEDLEEYLEKLCLLDLVGSRLGLSDLHNKNIMTQNLDPKVIDAEAYLTPVGVETGMWNSFSHGAGVMFDASCSGDKKYLGTNRISFAPSFRKRHLFRYDMSEENLEAIKINRSEIQKRCAERLPELSKAISEAGAKLETLPGRFVLIDTKSLNDEMRSLDPTTEKHVDRFVELIEQTIDEFGGYHFNDSAIKEIREQVKKDAMHNDIPAFSHDSTKGEMLYNGIVIGKYVG